MCAALLCCFNFLPLVCNTLTHSRCVVEDPHAISLYESFSAKFDVGDVPEADQKPFANKHMAMPCIIAMPI